MGSNRLVARAAGFTSLFEAIVDPIMPYMSV
jgi:hypothetical protein